MKSRHDSLSFFVLLYDGCQPTKDCIGKNGALENKIQNNEISIINQNDDARANIAHDMIFFVRT